ncbi:cytoplasmic dynein 2 light intermediate chain 1 [Panulirus ornatus]|uniref:cytoplasmic dynein 2 light intermediate chain 1 n=1 Tax=Panulirus ornatus TaxID=150431 RepID=UPI003A870699
MPRSAGVGSSGGGLSVWDVAVAEARRRRTESTSLEGEKAPREATLLLVGTRSAGKTTLLQRFLDREEAPRHTLALEYTYGRKTGRTLVKDVCHLWELGGGALFTPLLATPITPRVVSRLTLLLMLDLSRPDTIWSDLETLLSALKEEVQRAAGSVAGLQEELQEAAARRLHPHQQEEQEVTPFLVPLVIIGGKYDIFQDLEPEGKKMVCRALRYVAHTHGASLQFFSAKDTGLVKKAKELLSHYAFGTSESRSLAQDYNKPLIIPAGSDSLATINMSEDLTFDAWRHVFTTRFPQDNEDRSSVLPEDPARDPTYAEADVDNLRTQKDEELERIRREVGRSTSRWADLDLS